MGTFPAPQNFPIRNWLTLPWWSKGRSILTRLITARLVTELGRALCGNPTQPSSFGPNQLIKQGAKRATSWEDVIEELPTPVGSQLLPVEAAPSEERAQLVHESLAPAERTLCDLLTEDESRHIDGVVGLSGRTSSEVRAALFDLELKGVVRQLPGKQFLKVLL